MRFFSKTILGLFLFCVLFSGCTSFQLDPEALMRPPVMTEEQTEIYNAAEQIIGEDVIFKYPLFQGNHSAFVFYDIDGDQQEEAMVFYQKKADSNVRMNLLDQVENVWYSVGDYEGAGTDVGEVSFAHLNSTDQVDIVLEWSNVNASDMTITVMSFENGRLNQGFSNAYASKFIGDVDKDGIEELLIFTGSRGTASPAAMLVEPIWDGNLGVSSDCLMCPDVYEYQNIQKSVTSGGDIAVVLDGKRAQGAMSTEIIAYVEGQLKNLIYSEHYGLDYTEQTYRTTETLSTDIDYDGMVEIPLQKQLPSAESSTGTLEPIFLTNWSKWIDSQFQTMLSAVINTTYGYYFIYPSEWVDRVTVVVSQSNEWSFCPYVIVNGNVETESPLITIKAFSKTEYYDDFDTKDYEKLAENDQHAYYVKLGYLPDSNLNLSFEEVQSNFIPISE